MDRASWRNGAVIAALAGATMAVTAWLAAPGDEPDAPLPESHASQGGAPTPSFGVAGVAAEPGDPSGRWVGAMDLGGGSQAQFRFDLKSANGLLTGTASLPISEASIVNGRIRDRHLSFDIEHRLPSTGQVVLTRFSGEVHGDTITLDIHSEGAMSRLLVQRATPSP